MIITHCALCRTAISGQYLVDHWGNSYCMRHQGREPSCMFCDRFIGPGDSVPGAEVQHCVVCEATAVINDRTARAEFEKVRLWLHRQGVITRDPSLQLRLTSLRELDKIFGPKGGLTFGMTHARIVGNARPTITISMLAGLPSTLFSGSCAHELGHAWLHQHEIRSLPTIDEEGFCELLAFRYYTSRATLEGEFHAARIAESSHCIYGAGFRKLRALCDRYAFGHLLNRLAYYKQLPEDHSGNEWLRG